MLQVNPVNRPDIKEVLTGLEAIAIAMDVDLKGKVVSLSQTFPCRYPDITWYTCTPPLSLYNLI